jgi:hypothetical protein
MDSEYLGAWDFPTPKVGVIERVEPVKLPEIKGRVKGGRKGLITIRNCPRKLVFGPVIGEQIESMYGKDFANWVGKRIEMYATTCKVGKKVVDCVRVSTTIPGSSRPADRIEPQPVNEEMRRRQLDAHGIPYTEPEPEPDETPQTDP